MWYDAFTTLPFRSVPFPDYTQQEMTAILTARNMSQELCSPFVLKYTAARVRSVSLTLEAKHLGQQPKSSLGNAASEALQPRSLLRAMTMKVDTTKQLLPLL